MVRDLKQQNTVSAMQAELKQIKIKTGTLKRVKKELVMYQQELAKEQIKVNALKESGADASDIKYAVSGSRGGNCRCAVAGYITTVFNCSAGSLVQENILAEAVAVIPNTQQRLDAAFRDLQNLLVGCCSAHCWRNVIYVETNMKPAPKYIYLTHAPSA